MLNSRMLVALAASIALQAPMAAADFAPPCSPAADHSNYSGDHGLDPNGAWCPWDYRHIWKPQGVGCKVDSECQQGGNKCLYQFTNGRDSLGLNADVLLIQGIGYCGNGVEGGTQCQCGIPPLNPHPGGSNDYPTPGPGQDAGSTCREIFSKAGFPGANILAGCRTFLLGQQLNQCMYTCNGDEKTCPKGADPKAVHKIYPTLPSCPGYQ